MGQGVNVGMGEALLYGRARGLGSVVRKRDGKWLPRLWSGSPVRRGGCGAHTLLLLLPFPGWPLQSIAAVRLSRCHLA